MIEFLPYGWITPNANEEDDVDMSDGADEEDNDGANVPANNVPTAGPKRSTLWACPYWKQDQMRYVVCGGHVLTRLRMFKCI